AAFFAPVSLLAFPNASLRLKPLPFLCSSAETQEFAEICAPKNKRTEPLRKHGGGSVRNGRVL
ncbi:MAG: hypothetical protein IIZ00_05955, partial [Oscillospiraceae bacterium]|nr:hypothetical protein [Oscillospiraceae bacterium]